jgi:transposase
MVFRTRDLLVRQRTQLINALRGHLAELGIIAPHVPAHVKVLPAAISGTSRSLPGLVRDIGSIYLEQIALLDGKIAELEKVLRREAQRGTETCRLVGRHGVSEQHGPCHLGHGDETRGLSGSGSSERLSE